MRERAIQIEEKQLVSGLRLQIDQKNVALNTKGCCNACIKKKYKIRSMPEKLVGWGPPKEKQKETGM